MLGVVEAQAGDLELLPPEVLAPVRSPESAVVVGDEVARARPRVAGLGEDLDGGADVVDRQLVELLAGPVAGQCGLGDQRQLADE